jgi:hypothetical protein
VPPQSSPSALATRLAGRLRGLLALLALGLSSGCATYSERTAEARAQAAQGDYAAGAADLSRLLGVKEPGEQPTKFGDDTGLMLLERAMTFQAQGLYGLSARDLEVADKELELLDISGDVVGNIGKYIYSDSAPRYKASPFEKLALNALNILNYLAEGDLRGARVEAKRFSVMRDYLEERDPARAHGTIGSYLSGFVFEQLGEGNEAIRYYDEALADRSFETLKEPVARLATQTAYRGSNISDFLGRGEALVEPAWRSPDGPETGEILIVVALGRVPFKVPRRVPVGAAVGMAGAYVTGDIDVLRYSAFKVVVYPELVPAPRSFAEVGVQVDGAGTRVELVSNLGTETVREYEFIRPKIIGAAVSRMISRALIAEGVRAAGNQESSGLGNILALLAEGALVGMDMPDTRSWTLLPAAIYVARTRVAAGRHSVRVFLGGSEKAEREIEVEVPAGGYATAVVTTLR